MEEACLMNYLGIHCVEYTETHLGLLGFRVLKKMTR